MKKSLIVLVILSLIFVSCKKEELEEVNLETFDIRGNWKLVEATMYFALNTTSGGKALRKSNHFLGGNTESFLQDAYHGEILPIEHIVKNSIWSFRNSNIHIDKLDGFIDTILLNKKHSYTDNYPYFHYQTNLTSCFTWDSYKISSDKLGEEGHYAYNDKAFFSHTIGTYGDGSNRGIELIIHRNHNGSVNKISLLMVNCNAPHYINSTCSVGLSFNELVLEKIN